MAYLQELTEKFDTVISWRMREKYSKDEPFTKIINHIAENDYKSYYIAFETICEDFRIKDASFPKLSEFSRIPEEDLRLFYIKANSMFRHKTPRKPPAKVIAAEVAKITVLRLFMVWLNHRYPG